MKDIDYKLIGIRVKEARILMGISQEQLSWDTNLSASYISLIETGKKKPSLGSLLRISNTLGITIDELLSVLESA